MATVKGKVLVPFTYKGKQYQVDNEITFENPLHAATYEKNDYVKLDKEAEKKVDAALSKQEKNSKAGPGK
jgi:hypothetical protein